MAYNKAPTNSFFEHQIQEKFTKATGLTGKEASHNAHASIFKGLKGYEGYSSSLQEFPNFGNADDLDTSQVASLAEQGSYGKPAGLQGIEDDAFAGADVNFGGYLGADESAIAVAATEDDDDDDDDDEDDNSFDGYGGLADTPLESFHTYFHQATMARSDMKLIRLLAKAVKAVGDDTPLSVRRDFYNKAKEMLKRRKLTNLPHLDLNRAEIESNIGWLVDSSVPKTGGFKAILNKTAGAIGAHLGKGGRDDKKMKKGLAAGQKLKQYLAKSYDLSGLDGVETKYVGLVVASAAAAGLVWWLCCRKPAPVARKRKKAKKRAKKRAKKK